MMETLHSTSGFTSETSLPGRPQTPPYTPTRPIKRRLERSDSPASIAGSIHPIETDSPPKKPAKRVAIEDNIKVEELAEHDVGYHTDVDVVFPEEYEEISSNDSDDGRGTVTDVSDSETKGLTRRLSRLRCGDDREVDFEELRRRNHAEKRNANRISKRSHSQSAKNETDPVDSDALDDHDLSRSQRRLRRRVRGPQKAGIVFEDLLRSSPEIEENPNVAEESHDEEGQVEMGDSNDMDVDGE